MTKDTQLHDLQDRKQYLKEYVKVKGKSEKSLQSKEKKKPKKKKASKYKKQQKQGWIFEHSTDLTIDNEYHFAVNLWQALAH